MIKGSIFARARRIYSAFDCSANSATSVWLQLFGNIFFVSHFQTSRRETHIRYQSLSIFGSFCFYTFIHIFIPHSIPRFDFIFLATYFTFCLIPDPTRVPYTSAPVFLPQHIALYNAPPLTSPHLKRQTFWCIDWKKTLHTSSIKGKRIESI